MFAAIIIFASFKTSTFAAGTNYYVDCQNGADANNGLSTAAPWKTFNKVNATTFLAGDTINFKAGATCTGELDITAAKNPATSALPITYQTYASVNGSKAIFENPAASTQTKAIMVEASNIIVQDIKVQNTTAFGVYLYRGSSGTEGNNIVRNMEITDSGTGIAIESGNNLVTSNYIHDLKMIVNDPTPNNDYGALGIALYDSNNEISFNTIINCIAPSTDYGIDGGVIEIFGSHSNVNNNYIHNNYGANNEGFIEFGSNAGNNADNNLISYNILVNNGRLFYFHNSGGFDINVNNLKVFNNTIVETSPNPNHPREISFDVGGISSSFMFLQNNIFHIKGFSSFSQQWGFTHDHNIFYFAGASVSMGPGYATTVGELYSDPMFVDIAGGDYNLTSTSPAINAGTNLNLTSDFLGTSVPQNLITDIGAFEFVNAITPSPSPQPQPQSVPGSGSSGSLAVTGAGDLLKIIALFSILFIISASLAFRKQKVKWLNK